MAPSAQDQIYILSAVFGGVCSFLIFTTIFLFCIVYRMKKKLEQGGKENYIDYNSRGGVSGGGGVNSRNTGGGVGGGASGYKRDELEQRGYSSYPNDGSQNMTRSGGGGNIYNDQYNPSSRPQNNFSAGPSPGVQGPPGVQGGYDNNSYEYEQERKRQEHERNMKMGKMGGKLAGKGFNQFGKNEDIF